MDGLLRSVGNGITSLVAGAFDVIGDTLRGLFGAADRALPGGMVFVVAFFVLLAGAWVLAKR